MKPRWGRFCPALLLVASAFAPAQQPSLEDVVRLAREWGVPKTPPDAKLMIAENSGWMLFVVLRDGKNLIYSATGKLDEPWEGETFRDWRSITQDQLNEAKFHPVPAESPWVYGLRSLLLPVALADVGEEALGRHFLGRILAGVDDMEWDQLLAHQVFELHLDIYRTRPEVPREEVLRFLETIQSSGRMGKLEGGSQQDQEPDEALVLIERLRLSMKPNPHPPGTVAHDVFALVDSTTQGARFGASRFDAIYQRVEQHGFRAIPHLVEHVGDERLSRAFYGGGGPVPPHILRVDDLVYNLLVQFSGGELLKHRPLLPEHAREWWSQVGGLGEEEYLSRQALQFGGDWILAQLKEKASHRLPELAARALREEAPGRVGLIITLAQSDQPREVKLQLLRTAVSSRSAEIASSSARELTLLAPAEGRNAYQGVLEKLVKEELEDDSPYMANGAVQAVIGRASSLKEHAPWEALIEAIQLLPVDKRLVAIKSFWKSYNPDTYMIIPCPWQVQALTKFLDDLSRGSGRPGADGSGSSSEVVADRAASLISWALQINPIPNVGAGTEEWEAFRLKVREEAARWLARHPDVKLGKR
jgi:hypothetical protein